MKSSTYNKLWKKHNDRVETINKRREEIYRRALNPYLGELNALETERLELHANYLKLTCKGPTVRDEPILRDDRPTRPETIFPAGVKFGENVWTDGFNGTPYLWTSSVSAREALKQLRALGHKEANSVIKIETNAYGVEHTDGVQMVKQEAIQALGLVS